MSRFPRLPLASVILLATLLATFSGLATSTAAAADTPAVTFEDLKFEMKEGDKFEDSMITDEIKAKLAQPVKITGYISPTAQSDGLTQIVLMRNTMCLFGRDLPFHFVTVNMAKGVSTSYSTKPLTIEGSVKIKELTFDNRTYAVYHMDNAQVK